MATPLPQRVPENSPGDFYVERDVCLRCCLPHTEAPELLDDPEEGAPSCYFRRQPENEVEIEHALRAISVSCIDALHYGGSDPKILARLKELNGPSPRRLGMPSARGPAASVMVATALRRGGITLHWNGPAGRNGPCDSRTVGRPAGRSMLVRYAAGALA